MQLYSEEYWFKLENGDRQRAATEWVKSAKVQVGGTNVKNIAACHTYGGIQYFCFLYASDIPFKSC
jgi:hypothetical protein